MKYAVSNDGRSWRAISDDMQLLPGEILSETLPPEPPAPAPTYETAGQLVQLNQQLVTAQALGDVPGENQIKRAISRIKYLSKGV